MYQHKFLNLLVYSDSLAFRRPDQPQDVSFTYPFLLKKLIEDKFDINVNLIIRGAGGEDITFLKKNFSRDSGYFGGDKTVLNVAVFQCGVVDCAPRPFTYIFYPLIRRIPYFGEKIELFLYRHRRMCQLIFSYSKISLKKFALEYFSIKKISEKSEIKIITVGVPLPPEKIEFRSPGFQKKVKDYNLTISKIVPDYFCNIEKKIKDKNNRDKVLLPDGHHLSVEGHSMYANSIYPFIEILITSM